MQAWDFDAVAYGCETYCVQCLPDGVSVDDEEVTPIFATEEWTYPGVTCSHCGGLHDYMCIIGTPEDEDNEDEEL